MQTAALYSNWGISLWSIASNPSCSWSPLRRIVLLIASKWLEAFSFFSLKHLRIVFGVTNGQPLQFFDSFLRSLLPNHGPPAVMLQIQLWLFVCRALSILFRRSGPSVGLLFLWWKPAATVQIHFVKRIWKSRWSLCSLERLRALLCKPRLLSEHPSKRNLPTMSRSQPGLAPEWKAI